MSIAIWLLWRAANAAFIFFSWDHVTHNFFGVCIMLCLTCYFLTGAIEDFNKLAKKYD